jgi:exodeoxyribonuclease III
MPLKLISWNVNGIRTFIKKKEKMEIMRGMIEDKKPHILCFQETKLSCPIIDTEQYFKEHFNDFKYQYWSPCLSKGGYSGTAIFSKKKPKNVIYGLETGDESFDDEGRVITLEFDNYYVTTVYTANSGEGLKRIDFRVGKWDILFRKFIKKLEKNKPVIVNGDLNVAHHEIDIHNPKSNLKSSGFTVEERDSFTKLLTDAKLVDSFRHLHPEKVLYSYWTYLFSARTNNKGWRIDYFLVSDRIKKLIKKSEILTDITGSDHAPIFLNIDIKSKAS